jgi:glycosyltransferase involved in cell wall biosynthesis
MCRAHDKQLEGPDQVVDRLQGLSVAVGVPSRVLPQPRRLSAYDPMEASSEVAEASNDVVEPMTQTRPARTPPIRGDRRPDTRLLLVTSLYPTADRPEAGAFVAQRVQALRDRGVDVRVIAASTYRHGGFRRHLEMLWRALTARGRFDGIEGHVLFPASLVAWLAARLRGLPLVVYAHGWDVTVAARRTPIHFVLARLVARGASRVVTNSADTAQYVAALGAEAIVISPGVDLDRFRPGDRDAARSRLGIQAGPLLALYVGSIDRRKGADVFAAALDRAPGWRGILVGAGDLRPGLAAQHPGLRFEGTVAPAAIPDWMIAADVVIVPSRREPLGLAAIEALACATPVIASAVGGLRDVVLDGTNGILVPPEDPTAVASALTRLTEPEVRARLSATARASVLGHDLRLATTAMATVWRELGVAT